MQDLHSIAGAMGFVFGSAAVSASSSTGYRRSGGFRTPPPPPPPPPQQQQPLKCPRCDSTNTKFCYYNNYNLSQPRHFCKSCRRYWTRGGVLRNVPVGGASRKPSSKKPSPSPSSFSSSKKPSSISPSSSRSSASIRNRIVPQNPIPNPSFNPMGFSDGFAGILGSSVNRGVLVFGGGSDPAPITADELGIAGIADRNAHVDLISFQSGRTSCLAINGGDSDPGLIDLMSTVDRGSYWSNQSNPWGVTDSNLFFP